MMTKLIVPTILVLVLPTISGAQDYTHYAGLLWPSCSTSTSVRTISSSGGGWVSAGAYSKYGVVGEPAVGKVLGAPTDITEGDDEIPFGFELSKNYPNPFNTSTIIQYKLPQNSDVTIEIYDILGRRIETLIEEKQPAGYHQVTWDAKDRSSGMYFYRIKAGGYTETRKMVLLK